MLKYCKLLQIWKFLAFHKSKNVAMQHYLSFWDRSITFANFSKVWSVNSSTAYDVSFKYQFLYFIGKVYLKTSWEMQTEVLKNEVLWKHTEKILKQLCSWSFHQKVRTFCCQTSQKLKFYRKLWLKLNFLIDALLQLWLHNLSPCRTLSSQHRNQMNVSAARSQVYSPNDNPVNEIQVKWTVFSDLVNWKDKQLSGCLFLRHQRTSENAVKDIGTWHNFCCRGSGVAAALWFSCF